LWVGALICGLVLFAALSAPLIAPYSPDRIMAGPRLAPPNTSYRMGTDVVGRDMFSRVLYGAQIALLMAGFSVAISALLGLAPGLLAGYRGGWLDQVISRFMDVWLAFPGILLAIVFVARVGPSLSTAVVAIGIISAPGFYRLARSLALSVRRTAYVEAAHASGCSEAHIILRHVLPNVAPPLIVFATMRAGTAILAVGGLSFLGLGAQPPSPEWGAMLAAGRSMMAAAPWLAIYPGLCLTVTVVGLNLLGDGLRDLLDPKLCSSR
jgi:ABC-type dipeptide/oligopeptide/nickel transport system permease subunit